MGKVIIVFGIKYFVKRLRDVFFGNFAQGHKTFTVVENTSKIKIKPVKLPSLISEIIKSA